ncbi:MAG: copper chaperone PCu(A)C [Rhizobiaceae bacterium]
MLKRFVFAAVLASSFAAPVLAHEVKAGDLTINHPWARATAPGAPVSGGYMTITNSGTAPDFLVGGAADFAAKVEIHEMVMDGDVMKMRPVEGGIEVPAGGSVELKPGGLHVMFMGMKKQLVPDTYEKATLVFRNAGEVAVEFAVEEMKMPQMDHSAHGAQSGQQN